MSFVETIVGSDELAREFRDSFKVVIVPLVNPDGVAAGYWRHNVSGVDLNRDWGPFTQPETRAVRGELLKYRGGANPRMYLLLDFHSTHRDLFYVQTSEQPTQPADFAQRWLKALSLRVPRYTVRQVATAGDKPTSTKWGYETFRVPSITYECGDNTDRVLLRRVARCAAEEMMTLLLLEMANSDAGISDEPTPTHRTASIATH
jgi:predicted deacylase